MSGSFSVVIAVLFSGVIAVLVIAAANVFCVRPVLSARRHGGDRGRDGLSASPDRERELAEQPTELDALGARQPDPRHEIRADAERRP